MKKSKKSEKKSQKSEQSSQNSKKGLFDHLNEIRTTKDPNYYNTLTYQEKKGFSHWMILYGLSMDNNLIELIAFLWRDEYYDKIPSPQFYKLLVDLVPQTNQRLFWIKKSKRNEKLVDCISKWYSISNREAQDYLDILFKTDKGIGEIGWILEGLGLTEKEAEKVLLGEDKDE